MRLPLWKCLAVVVLFSQLPTPASAQLRSQITGSHKRIDQRKQEWKWTDHQRILFSPDGKYFVTLAGYGITVWDAKARKELRSFGGKHVVEYSYYDPSLAVFLKGKSQLVVSEGEAIKIYDIPSGRVIRTFPAGVPPLAVTPDASKLAFTRDRYVPASPVEIYDPNTGKLLSKITVASDQRAEIEGILFSPDGRFLALVVDRNDELDVLQIFEVATGKQVAASGRLCRSVTGMAFDPTGDRLYTMDYDSSRVIVWSVPDLSIRSTIPKTSGHGLELSADGNLLLVWNNSAEVRVWHAPTLKHIGRFTGQNVTDVAVSPDSKTIASVGGGNNIDFWEWQSLTRIVKPTLTIEPKRSGEYVRFTPDGKRFGAICGSDADIHIFDADTGRVESRFSADEHKGRSDGVGYTDFLFFGEGPFLAARHRGNLALWDMKEKTLKVFQDQEKQGYLQGQRVSSDGKYLAHMFRDRTTILSAETGKVIRRFEFEGDSGSLFAVSPGGRLIVYGRKVYNIETGGELFTIPYFSTRFHITRDGKSLVCLTRGYHRVCICDLKSGRFRTVGHDDEYLEDVALLYHDRIAATAMRDGRIRLWEIASGRLLVTLQGHTKSVSSVDGSWDGKKLVSAGGDGKILVWDISEAIALLDGKNPIIAAEDKLPTSKVITTSSGAKIRITFPKPATEEEIRAALREALEELDR